MVNQYKHFFCFFVILIKTTRVIIGQKDEHIKNYNPTMINFYIMQLEKKVKSTTSLRDDLHWNLTNNEWIMYNIGDLMNSTKLHYDITKVWILNLMATYALPKCPTTCTKQLLAPGHSGHSTQRFFFFFFQALHGFWTLTFISIQKSFTTCTNICL